MTPPNLLDCLGQASPDDLIADTKITSRGIQLHQHPGTWWAEWMIAFKGQEVTVLGDPKKPEMELTVFRKEEGAFLGNCSRLMVTP